MRQALNVRIENLLTWYLGHRGELACLAAFLIPLKLIFFYFVALPSVLLEVAVFIRKPQQRVISRSFQILAIFALIALTASLFGINPGKSISRVSGLVFFIFAIPFFQAGFESKGVKLTWCLILGQSLAALHSSLEAIMPNAIPPLFLGKVTESGQLALVIPLTIGAFFHEYRRNNSSQAANKNKVLGVLAICLALLFTALVVNLKRGPWAGVLIALSVYLFIHARRYVGVVIFCALFLSITVTPIRERLLSSVDHFYIVGGRNEIWEIGFELMHRYPIGIGFDSSPFLRQFAEDIPPQHRHFHNNLLNIAVEEGILGLLVYCWWILRIIAVSLTTSSSRPFAHVIHAIGCGVLASALAGAVEYNFGDSEVYFATLCLVGMLEGVLRASARMPRSSRANDSP